MANKVTKAVFPVGGMGTRFLPATKANPKEMLPVVDKPLIQYAVEEAIRAGCEQLIFVTGRGKRAIADHFDVSYELETELETAGKQQLLEMVREILPSHVTPVYIRQPKPLGLGHAVNCARSLIGDEPFAVLLADDLIDGGERTCLEQMVTAQEHHQASVLAVQQVDPDQTHKYGIVGAKLDQQHVGEVKGIVEKPAPAAAPSNLAVVGRYILSSRIFDMLDQVQPGAGGEIQLTDAIGKLMDHEPVIACEFTGRRYDCGSKMGYLEATVEYALKHPEVGADFRRYLRGYCQAYQDEITGE